MNSLKGFTIWEALVAMIISGIVVTIAIETIPDASKNNQDIVAFNNSLDELYLIDQVIRRDLYSCEFTVFNKNYLTIDKQNNSLIYEFNEESICTFNGFGPDTLFSGDYYFAISTISSKDALVKELLLGFPVKKDTINFLYTISYPKATLYGRNYKY